MIGMAMKALAVAAIPFGGICLSMVVGGFVFGFVHANTGEASGFDVLGRLFLASYMHF